MYTTAPQPLVTRVLQTAPLYTLVHMVRACCMHDHKLTVRHAHLKLVDQPPTKVRRLIPFPVLLLYRTSWTTCSKLPYYVSVFPGLFHSLSPTYALYAAQIFRIIRTPILSAITIRRNTYAATFRNVGTLPRSPCIAVRTGLVMTKIVRICPSVFVCHTQGLCWPKVRRTAYTFRVPGSVFKAGFIFPSFFFIFLAHLSPSNIQEVQTMLKFVNTSAGWPLFSVVVPSFATQPVLIYSKLPKPNCCHLPLVLPTAFSMVDVAQIQHNAAFPLIPAYI